MMYEHNDIKKVMDELQFYYGTLENKNNLKLDITGDSFVMSDLEDMDIEKAYMAAKAQHIK